MKKPRFQPVPKDAELWHRLAKDVKPLKRKAPSRAAETAAAEPEPSRPAPRRVARVTPTAAPVAAKTRPAELAAGRVHDIDRRTAARLRRGRLDIEARIDLHGRGREDARAALADFLTRAMGRGLRCVLVITGKGLRGDGVIRRDLPRWLNDVALRPHIVAFTEAQPKDGGSGAFYVYLRRRRDP